MQSGRVGYSYLHFNYKLTRSIFISTYSSYSNPVMGKDLSPLTLHIYLLLSLVSTRILPDLIKNIFPLDVLCYDAASLVSLVGVLVVRDALDQRVIW